MIGKYETKLDFPGKYVCAVVVGGGGRGSKQKPFYGRGRDIKFFWDHIFIVTQPKENAVFISHIFFAQYASEDAYSCIQYVCNSA